MSICRTVLLIPSDKNTDVQMLDTRVSVIVCIRHELDIPYLVTILPT